ncbi:integral membrane protein DGCR2/IDD-like isoform X1 [Xyrauchen texanus]|uniref:integral membrane protein DGCR2/IDD-like isoform X1 n=1 Tax=Xyrauchen texanus TaxID=154827 RepID=UPI00224214DF|nr:integral membrane protein DGCR2/IDD-like isoform X1 [Xyrauchen texanus]
MLPKADSGGFVLLLFFLTLTGPRLALARLLSELRCSPGQFACRSGKMQCIPLSWQCDGWTACEDKSDEIDCPTTKEEMYRYSNSFEPVEDVMGVAQPVRFNKKCPSGWHHYEKTASCYKVYLRSENYWQAVETCQKVNGSLATFGTNEELQFVLKIEVDFDEKVCERKDQCKFWVGYQYVITSQNHSLEGRWEVAYKGSMQVFLPPEGLVNFGEANPTQGNVFCAQLQRFQIKSMNERGLHSWHAENCYKKFPFLCKRRQTCVDINDNVMNEGYYFTPKGDDPCLSCMCHEGEPEMCVAALCERPQGCQHFRKDPKECCKFTCLDPGQTCVDIKDNVVNEGYYFTPKGDDPCLSCTCHEGEPEMCVAALCERPQGCQHFRKDPKECCKFTCLDPDGNSLFDSMASGMRLIVSCISSFLILSLLLFMVHRLRQRRRERIETLIGGNLHHFNLGRRVPGFDYGPDTFGTGLTPLHLSDDGEGGAFHFQEPPPPYAAYKYPDIHHPEDPPPPYEASINQDSIIYMDLGRTGIPLATRHVNAMADSLQRDFLEQTSNQPPPLEEREDSIDSSTLLVSPDTPSESDNIIIQSFSTDCSSGPSLSTVV